LAGVADGAHLGNARRGCDLDIGQQRIAQILS
jgi:hypothetical protein